MAEVKYRVTVRVKRCDVKFTPDLPAGVLGYDEVAFDDKQDVHAVLANQRDLILDDIIEVIYESVPGRGSCPGSGDGSDPKGL